MRNVGGERCNRRLAWQRILGLAVLPLLLLNACSPRMKHQPLIGLITDYGTHDAYVAQLKGSIYTINGDARIVDLSHGMEPFNIVQGAFILAESSQEFPAGTIFVVVIDPGVGSPRLPILMKTKVGKYYVGPDNGVMSLVLQREELDKAWQLDKPELFRANQISSTFHGRDIFGPIAARLAEGEKPESLGSPLKSLQQLDLPVPKTLGQVINGEVINIDQFGNLITNIPRGLTNAFVEGKVYRLSISKQTLAVPLVKSYGESPPVGRLLMLFNSSNLLEIAVNQGSAARLLKTENNSSFTIQP